MFAVPLATIILGKWFKRAYAKTATKGVRALARLGALLAWLTLFLAMAFAWLMMHAMPGG